jgi:uncharacterized protein (DUF433 family)
MPDLIRKTPGVVGGRARVGNRRIAVWMLVQAERLGMPREQVRTQDEPPLTHEEMEAAWRYYEAHREEIEKDVRENEED